PPVLNVLSGVRPREFRLFFVGGREFMLAWSLLFGLSILLIALVLLFLWHPRVGELFHQHVKDRPKRRLFLAAVGFFLTLALARSMACAAGRKIAPFHYIYIRGTHVHHLVWGILLLLVVGFCWLIEVGTGTKGTSLLASRKEVPLVPVPTSINQQNPTTNSKRIPQTKWWTCVPRI